MTPSLINPAAAPFFFQAFQAYPESGRMTVPVQLNPLSSVVAERTLTPQNIAGFARTLGLALAEITARFPPGQMTASLPGDWTAIHNGPKRLLVENVRLGKAVVFDRGGHLTERLTGHRSGAAVAVRQSGIFAGHEMAAAVSLKHALRWMPVAYQLKFEGCGVAVLKTFLGLSEDATVFEAGLALYGRLGMIDEPRVQAGLLRELAPGSPLDIEISGASARGDRILIRAGFDPASHLYGENVETLIVDALPADETDQRLPEPLHPVWALGRQWSELYLHEDATTRDLMDAYTRRTFKIYGPPVLLPAGGDN